VSFRELAGRRAWLLDAIGSAGPGANHHGVRTAALVLPAVIAELDLRGRTYAKSSSLPFSCTCGFSCTGLAAFDDHLDQYPPGGPVTCASGERAAFWVGLDGYGTPTVEQTGTAVTCQGSTAVYQAWYEMYPAAPVYFPNPVHPGDDITASVVFNQGFSYTLTISDAHQGWTQTVHASAPNAVRSTAEVIVEAPVVNGAYAPLANFGTAGFGRADINGRFITSYSPTMLYIADSKGNAEDSVSETELGTLSVRWLRSN
jgi:hypothetical protein